MSDLQQFGEMLKLLRETEGFSKSKLGRRLGCSHTAISRYENGVNYPNDEILEKILGYFDVDLKFFFNVDVTFDEWVDKSLEEKLALLESKKPKLGFFGKIKKFFLDILGLSS